MSGPSAELEATPGRHLLRETTPEFPSRRLSSDQGAALFSDLPHQLEIQPNVDIQPTEGLGFTAR